MCIPTDFSDFTSGRDSLTQVLNVENVFVAFVAFGVDLVLVKFAPSLPCGK